MRSLRDLLATPTIRHLQAECDRLTGRLEAEQAAHANTRAERAPSATVLDQLDAAKQAAADLKRRTEWLGLENERLRNRIKALETQPTDLPADTRELRRRLWLTEQARASLAEQLATVQAANDAMNRQEYDRAVAAEQAAEHTATTAAA